MGPAEYTHKEVYEFVSDVTHLKKPLVDVPLPIARLTGRLCNQFVSPFFTPDNIELLCEDVVARDDPSLKTFSDLGIEPASMDKVAFDYLHRFRRGGHFTMVKGYH